MKPIILSDDEFNSLPDAETQSNSPMVLSDDEFNSLPDSEEVSQTESAIRGAAQEVSFGLADEVTAAAETLLSSGDISKDKYYKILEDTRKLYKKAEEANPKSYLAGQVAGGILPAVATGGTSVATKLAAGVAKPALASLVKKGLTSGLLYGAGQGVGKSEAKVLEGEVGKLAKDIALESALGGAAGAVMPLAAPALKGAAKSTSKALRLLQN